MKIEIANYRSLDKGGALKGAFTLVMPELSLRIDGCKHFASNGREWFNFPQREVKNAATGKTDYYPVVTCFDRDKLEAMRVQVMQEISKQAPQVATPKPQETNGWF